MLMVVFAQLFSVESNVKSWPAISSGFRSKYILLLVVFGDETVEMQFVFLVEWDEQMGVYSGGSDWTNYIVWLCSDCLPVVNYIKLYLEYLMQTNWCYYILLGFERKNILFYIIFFLNWSVDVDLYMSVSSKNKIQTFKLISIASTWIVFNSGKISVIFILIT